MDAADLTEAQLNSFSTIERVCSVFSLLGCVTIITTFSVSKAFHKPINRLVFYASFGNTMSNVATLIARAALGDIYSGSCIFQAFLVQMFMPADAFWTLAMAVNVYLTFYYKFDAQRLREMEPVYLGLCYGIPFVIALVFVFVKTPDKGPMYGNATLWCWVGNNWDIFRITTFYGPAWAVILITFFIYLRAGREIYQRHRQLQRFGGMSSADDADPMPTITDGTFPSKTTEISVTSETIGNDIDMVPLSPRNPAATAEKADDRQDRGNHNYSVIITSHHNDFSLPIQSNSTTASVPPETARTAPAVNPVRRRANDVNKAAWSYTKCALLFFTAMLVTWIPSSANRLFSVLYPGQISLRLEYMSAFVLPLQGFWNTIVYVITSWSAFKALFGDVQSFFRHREVVQGRRPTSAADVLSSFRPGGNNNFHKMGSIRGGARSNISYESESVTELAPTRQGTDKGSA